jgi:hypothetical protein
MKSYLRGYIFLNMFVLLSALLFLVSCNKDETTTGPNSGSTGAGSTYLTFKVNGIAMDLSTSATGYYSTSSSSPGTYITSSPSGFTHPELDLGFPGKTTGTFTETSGGWLDYTDANNVDYYYSPYTCTITVTQYGNVGDYIVGTFTATKHSSNSTATITEGKFSVKRTY